MGQRPFMVTVPRSRVSIPDAVTPPSINTPRRTERRSRPQAEATLRRYQAQRIGKFIGKTYPYFFNFFV
jgi:hypothetical protein